MLQGQLIPWEERIRNLKSNRISNAILPEKRFSYFFHGVEMLLQSKYSEWVFDKFFLSRGWNPKLSWGFMIGYIMKWIEEDQEKGEPTFWPEQELYYLMIEPFYLINEKEKEESHHVSGNHTKDH